MNNMKYKFNVGLYLLALVMIISGCDDTRHSILFPPAVIFPTVISSSPANRDLDVALNTKIGVTFSAPMDASTITASTFILKSGSAAISGVFTYTGITSVFAPSANLAPNTIYTATITSGTKDVNGNSLANNYVWSFTTGTSTVTVAPTVNSTDPPNSASDVALNQKISATFSSAMDPVTISTSTFILKQGVTLIPGTISYAGKTAIYTTANNLSANTTYTVTITTGSKDLTGNALANNYSWIFTTGTAIGYNVKLSSNPAAGGTTSGSGTFISGSLVMMTALSNTGYSFTNWTENGTVISTNPNFQFNISGDKTYVANFAVTGPVVVLGAAATYGGFGGSAGLTNQGIFTVIHGDIGTTAVSTSITGLHDGSGNIFTETPLNVGLVTGTILCAPPLPGTPANFAKAQQALLDATTAFNYLKGLPGGTDPGAGELGGLVLTPGTYTAASGTFKITNGDLTLDAQNNPSAVWVFQMAQSLTVGKAGLPRSITLVNGAQAKNIFWQVGSAATINGAGGGTMAGTIISYSGVTFSTAGVVALTTFNGRALSLNASVTFVNTIVNIQ